jgi:hypothetical protein
MKGLLHHKNLAAFPAAFFWGLIAIPATDGSAPDVRRSSFDLSVPESCYSFIRCSAALGPDVWVAPHETIIAVIVA